MNNHQPIIQTNKVTRVYDELAVPVRAVDGVSLTVEAGEFTALVGPSGSGKTTLLNLIGGLDHPTSGKVWVNGVDISAMKRNKLIDFRLHNIGFVFQAYNLIPVLTAKENVEFVMLLQKRPKEERERRVRELFREVDLEDRMDNRPSELSGGQQQ
ncbi:MAG: ATP-binding cassette domain-containing protein, partial [Bacteroidota bacterium]